MRMHLEKQEWYRYMCKNRIRAHLRQFKLAKFANSVSFKNENWLEITECQNAIRDYILSGTPAMIARYGSNEARITANAIGIKLGAIHRMSPKALVSINRNAGVFPYGLETAYKFGMLMEQSSKEVDLLGCWDTLMQDYLVDHCCNPDMKRTKLRNLEPYYAENPWTTALRGLKVAVIHPFKATIQEQYQKREGLFASPSMLPDFELTVIKAVQTIAYAKDKRFASWFDALDYMTEQVEHTSFDVAIIGCGAYGFPLAARIKRMGKVAIHLGGATQLLFGIKGGRWDTHPFISKLYNESWIRPLEEDRPANSGLIENGCYW